MLKAAFPTAMIACAASVGMALAASPPAAAPATTSAANPQTSPAGEVNSSAAALYAMAVNHLRVGKWYARAAGQLQQAVAAAPNSAKYREALGCARFSEAMDAASWIWKGDGSAPAGPEAARVGALVKAALRDLRSAERLAPSEATYPYTLGWMYWVLANTNLILPEGNSHAQEAAAVRSFRQGMALAPRDARFPIVLGDIYRIHQGSDVPLSVPPSDGHPTDEPPGAHFGLPPAAAPRVGAPPSGPVSAPPPARESADPLAMDREAMALYHVAERLDPSEPGIHFRLYLLYSDMMSRMEQVLSEAAIAARKTAPAAPRGPAADASPAGPARPPTLPAPPASAPPAPMPPAPPIVPPPGAAAVRAAPATHAVPPSRSAPAAPAVKSGQTGPFPINADACIRELQSARAFSPRNGLYAYLLAGIYYQKADGPGVSIGQQASCRNAALAFLKDGNAAPDLNFTPYTLPFPLHLEAILRRWLAAVRPLDTGVSTFGGSLREMARDASAQGKALAAQGSPAAAIDACCQALLLGERMLGDPSDVDGFLPELIGSAVATIALYSLDAVGAETGDTQVSRWVKAQKQRLAELHQLMREEINAKYPPMPTPAPAEAPHSPPR